MTNAKTRSGLWRSAEKIGYISGANRPGPWLPPSLRSSKPVAGSRLTHASICWMSYQRSLSGRLPEWLSLAQ